MMNGSFSERLSPVLQLVAPFVLEVTRMRQERNIREIDVCSYWECGRREQEASDFLCARHASKK